ncbi:hypothetical protein ACFL59_03490 [Planctomycetota bacterium]
MIENALPSQHTLLPNLGVLDRLLLKRLPSDRVSAVQRATEQLPYYLRGACFALGELERHRHEAVTALEVPGLGPNTRAVLSADRADPLSFALDFYLFCLRRSFDALIPYISRCPVSQSLPSSMHDLVKALRKGKWQLDNKIQAAILAFWTDVGARIKGYRDQANHKAVILSNCVAFRSEGRVALRMLLPDDHEEKQPSKLKYEPGVPAMGFAVNALEKSLRFVNVLVERMIDMLAPVLADADLQIAATALQHDLELVTGNVRHFERVPGLRLSKVFAAAREAT